MQPFEKAKDEEARALFRTGVYRHYKGGEYSAVGLTRHHDTGRSFVLYTSLTTGSLRIRPLVRFESDPSDVDAWTDEVTLAKARRFAYRNPLP